MITNIKNGMIYIGESSNLVDRMSQYRTVGRHRIDRDRLNPIGCAIYDEGIENFQYRFLVTSDELPKLKDDVYRRKVEAHFIIQYNATDPTIGYNAESENRCKKRGVKKGTPVDISTKILKSDPIIVYTIETGEVVMMLGSQSACDILGFPKDGRAMIARCCHNGKSSHGYYFFKFDYKEREKHIAHIIKEKGSPKASNGKNSSSLKKEAFNRYVDAVKAVNKWCKAWGYKTVDLDKIMKDANISF